MDKIMELHQRLRREFVEAIPPWPGASIERGIVICGGGDRYLPGVWVLVKELQHLGCRLPVQVWHLGAGEMPKEWGKLLQGEGVECVDAFEVRKAHPARILNGWEVKPFAMLHNPFRELILLDADNIALRDPGFLFETEGYRATGAIFWPDLGRLGPEREIWKICELEYRDEPEFESGQIVVHKERCWRELNLTMHLNEYSDYYYKYIHGDKETFHMAWRMLGSDYAMPSRPVEQLRGVLCQHDFDGHRLFQHRAGGPKWMLQGNRRIPGFLNEARCLAHLEALREPFSARPAVPRSRESPAEVATPSPRPEVPREIPRALHLFEPLFPHEGLQECQQSFQVINPHWETKVWDEAKAVAALGALDGVLAAQISGKWSDPAARLLAKWAILYHFGGIAADPGVECRRPLDDLVASLEGESWEVAMAVDHPLYQSRLWNDKPLLVDDFILARPGSRLAGQLIASPLVAMHRPEALELVQGMNSAIDRLGGTASAGVRTLPWEWIHPIADPEYGDDAPRAFMHWAIREQTWQSDFDPYVVSYRDRAWESAPLLATHPGLLLQPASELVRRRLRKYDRFLAIRRKTSVEAIAQVAETSDRCIAELGVTRSFVSGWQSGCMSADPVFWQPDKPERWDWGAGAFTRLAVEALQGMEFSYTGIDTDPKALQIARRTVEGLRGNVAFHQTASSDFLRTWEGRADMIYFDHGDVCEEAARMHARDAEIVLNRGLIRPGGFVLIDDHGILGANGKSVYSLPLFLNAGYRIVQEGYQILLQAPGPQASLNGANGVSSGHRTRTVTPRMEASVPPSAFDIRAAAAAPPSNGKAPAGKAAFQLTGSLCREEDFRTEWYAAALPRLGETLRWHRKQWEFCFIYEALRERGMLTPGRKGLGFGVGREPLVAALAAAGCSVVATDLDASLPAAQGWRDGGQHADSLRSLNDRGLASPDAFANQVSFRSVDMNAIPKDLGGFDFTWSSCSLEHVGSLRQARLFLRSQMDCLAPGGWAVHTTEYNLSSNTATIETGHTVLWRRRDVEEVLEDLRRDGHEVEVDFTPGTGEIESHVDFPPYSLDRHLRLQIEQYACTSLALIIRRRPKSLK